MTNDFGADFATEIAAMFYDGTQIPAPAATAYVTLYDDTGTELNADLQNGRVGIAIPGDVNQGANATEFENAVEINFGETTADITVQEFAIKDSDADDATAKEYFRGAVTNAPQDYANGTRVFYNAGELAGDILDALND
jgi:hypothetical protein